MLDRFLRTAQTYNLDVVVRLTGDNPFVMASTIEQAIEAHIKAGADYTLTEGLPLGTNIEVVSFTALERAASEATEPADREHVTSYIRRERNFKLNKLAFNSPINTLRLTVDFPSDYALASMLYERLGVTSSQFGFDEIEKLVQENEWLAAVNAQNTQRQPFVSEADEFAEAEKVLRKGGFARVLQKLWEVQK